MPSNSTTYIVIEVQEKENALDIINILMTHTKARFTTTNDIQEYALERSHLKKPEEARKPAPEPKVLQKPFEPVLMEPPPHKRASYQSTDNDELIDVETIETKPRIFGEELDYDEAQEDEEWNDQPTTSKSPRVHRVVPAECTVCKAKIRVRGFDYSKRSAHAIIHTPIMRFVCSVKNCGSKARHRADVVRHGKIEHPNMTVQGPKNCMTPQQVAELRVMTNKCFPEIVNRHADRKRMRAEEQDK